MSSKRDQRTGARCGSSYSLNTGRVRSFSIIKRCDLVSPGTERRGAPRHNMDFRGNTANRQCLKVSRYVTGVPALGRIQWTARQFAGRTASQIRLQFRSSGPRRGADVTVHRPFLLGGVNFGEIVDAGIGLGGSAGTNQVWDGDGCQKANDGHHDHQFDEREAALSWTTEMHVACQAAVLIPFLHLLINGEMDHISPQYVLHPTNATEVPSQRRTTSSALRKVRGDTLVLSSQLAIAGNDWSCHPVAVSHFNCALQNVSCPL